MAGGEFMSDKSETPNVDQSDEQRYLDWEGQLCDEANRHYLQYCQSCAVATTVLLGFIFDSVYKGTNLLIVSPSVSVTVPILIKIGWFGALLSLVCGLMYLFGSANRLFETARGARRIANEAATNHKEKALKDFYDLKNSLEGTTRREGTDEGPYRPGHRWLLAQTWLLGIALVLTSVQLFCR